LLTEKELRFELRNIPRNLCKLTNLLYSYFGTFLVFYLLM